VYADRLEWMPIHRQARFRFRRCTPACFRDSLYPLREARDGVSPVAVAQQVDFLVRIPYPNEAIRTCMDLWIDGVMC
jgi:hypothetical protein